jgi:Tfp pilus assembly protein PilF
MMFRKSALSSAFALSIIATTCSAASAELDAAQINKRKVVIHTCLLTIYVSQRKRPQANVEYQTLTALSPTDAKLFCQYGQFLAQGGTPADYTNAAAQLKKAVALDPSNAQYNGILGTIYLKLKNPTEALKWLKNAVQYGGTDYKKTYEETWKYIEELKRINTMKKRQEEAKKQQQQQAGAAGKPGAKKGGDDDDDDDW